MAGLALVGSCVWASSPVVNPGFESRENGSPKGWTVAETAYVATGGRGMNGSAALQFHGASDVVCSEPVNQDISLTPGVAYRLTAWAKTEDLKSERRGAGVGIEWWSAKGAFRDLRTKHLTGTVGEWTRLEVVTPRIPEGLRRCRLVVYAGYGKTSGRAWFDELIVEPLSCRPISGLHCDAYRGRLAKGTPLELKASLDVPEDVWNAHSSAAVLSWRASDGTMQRKAPESFTRMTATFRFRPDELPVGVHDLTCVLSTNGVAAGRATCRIEQLATEPLLRVRFDRFGRTLVDGKTFFPLAVYEMDTPESHMKRLRESGVNTVLDYTPCTREKLDAYHRNGLKVIYGLKDAFFGSSWPPKEITCEADEIPYVTSRVNSYKTHPALLAWYLNDEMPIDMIPRLTKRRQLFEDLDPDHPTFNCLWQIEYIRDYMDCTDIIGTDPYPVARAPLSRAADWTIDTRRNTMGLRPMWQIPQAFSWKWFKSGGPNDRMPTSDEMRSMSWQMIACGANGLVFYSSSGIRNRSEPGDAEKNFAMLAEVTGEFARLTDILTSEPSEIRYKSGRSQDVLPVRFWRKGNETFALFVNATDADVSATVETDRLFSMVEMVFGMAAAAVDGHRLSVTLGPWKQVLVRLR